MISEYPPGAARSPAGFRARNRITAGLSVAAVVVEAPRRSGALLFADEAASQGFTGGMPERMGDVYVKLLSGRGDAFARMIRIFAQHSDGTVLFNCTAGKDRTGVTAMLLLLLAGVPCEIVVADYSVSEANMRDIFKRQKAWLK